MKIMGGFAMTQLELVCTVCGTNLTITQKPSKQKSKKEKHFLWCFKCGTERDFINSEIAKENEFRINDMTKNTNPAGEVKKKPVSIKRPRIIGQCTYPYHPKEMTWSMIHTEKCLEKRCNYFSWISLFAMDKWRREHGFEKRPAICRIGTVKERKERRRKTNTDYLMSHDIDWEWVDKKADHILIEGVIDYYLGSTRWSNRKTGDFGYQMVRSLLAK